MTAPNANTLWARTIVEELVAADITSVCLCPGSRSTPLTLAFANHDDVTTYSLLDERSAAYFALGRGRITGEPTPIVTTSGTATANLHPAVLEADTGRVPLLVLTADRPPELQDSGVNQTVDQTKLYGDAVRWFHDPGIPDADPRSLRSLRTATARAVGKTMRPPAGPVHLNFPFRKPLEPVDVPDEIPADFAKNHPCAATGRSGPYVTIDNGMTTPSPNHVTKLGSALSTATTPLIIAGPLSPWESPAALAELADELNAPLLADPLSGLRYGPHIQDAPIIGQYDLFLTDQVTADWPDPDTILRVGASPTSQHLQSYLAGSTAIQFLLDPAVEWRDTSFTTHHLIGGDITPTVDLLLDEVSSAGSPDWRERFHAAETTTQSQFSDLPFGEGPLISTLLDSTPADTTILVSNSTPIRDFDRFTSPTSTPLQVLGNRGASGIDGITSTAFGAASATDGPLVAVLGDLAYYHDMNGLLAAARCNLDATIVLINNDGGGIFHMLPIEEYDPPFTEHFRTPHNLDFEPSTTIYDLDYTTVTTRDEFETAYTASLDSTGTQVIETKTNAEASHRLRERLQERVEATLTESL